MTPSLAGRAGGRVLLLVGLTAAAYVVGLAVGSRWLLPVLNAAPAWALMASRLRAGDRRGAVGVMLAWAAALAILGTLFFAFWPRPVDGVVLHGAAYRDEMFRWIRTGEGSEGQLTSFLPLHLRDLALFAALSLATASTASILMGAVLVNYMDFYVASLFRAGAPGWATVAFGWQPYALCRVAAFCVLGTVLAEPLLSRVTPYRYAGLASARPWLLVAAGGILLDWVLKALIAPLWSQSLRALLPA